MSETHILTRSELYALVWEKAVQQVAKEIGVSDVAVAKACRRNRIPTPERGYWRRKEWGYKVRQPPLPPLPNGADPAIVFHATPRTKEASPQEPLSPEEEFEQRPENRVVVPEAIDRLSKAVRHTRATLRKHRPDYYDLLETRAKDCFRVHVSPANLDRAVRILQALSDAFTARGYELAEADEPGSGLRVRVKGETLSVSLSERVKRVPHVLSEREEIRAELNPGWKPPTHDWQPTGVFALRIDNAPGPSQHATVRDKAKEPLEQRLNVFLARMAESARQLKEVREARERERLKWEAEQKAREEARRKAEVEAARFRRMDRLARHWERRERLVRFVEAVKERMQEARPELVPTAQAWVDWAEKYLDDHRPVDQVFFEPLLTRDSKDFYHWTGNYGERDDWIDYWGG